MACCCIDSTPMRRLRTGCSPVIGHLPPPAPVMSALCFTTPALKRRLSTDSEPQSAVLHARSCLFCQCWVRPPPALFVSLSLSFPTVQAPGVHSFLFVKHIRDSFRSFLPACRSGFYRRFLGCGDRLVYQPTINSPAILFFPRPIVVLSQALI